MQCLPDFAHALGFFAAELDRPTSSSGYFGAHRHDVVDGRQVGVEPIWAVLDRGGVQVAPSSSYAAVVLDVFTRVSVGWQVPTSLRTDLALDALDMGLWTRQRAGRDGTGLVHHSDCGVRYRAIRYTERLAEAETVASVGSRGDSYDNAMGGAQQGLLPSN